jgi:hypothetical protein
MYVTLRSTLIAVVVASALTACDSGPKNYDDCMLQASRTAKNDRQFRKLAEQCKENFSTKEE